MTEQCTDIEHSTVLSTDETEQQYQERLVVLCLDQLFRHTQLPKSIAGNVWEIIERHGVWAGLATAKLVVDAFEAGKR